MNKPIGKEKIELPFRDNFIIDGSWIRKNLRKGLTKKSREFYYVRTVNKLDDDRWLIELEKEYRI